MSKNWKESTLYHEGMSLRNLALSEFDRRGILLNSTEFASLRKSVSLKGKKLYEGPFRNILGDALFAYCNSMLNQEDTFKTDLGGIRFVESIPISLSFGYEFGFAISKLFGCNATDSASSAWTCALAHNTGSLFDILLDNMPEKFPAATRIIYDAFEQTFNIRRREELMKPNNVVLNDLFLTVFARSAKAFGANIKKICKYGRRDIVTELHDTVAAVLDAEVRSAFCKPRSANRWRAIFEHQQRRNSMPFWGEGLICMLHADSVGDLSIEKWKDIFLRFGDIFWVIDSIADFADDLRCKHWNYLVLKLARLSGHSLDEGPPGTESQQEIYTGIIQNNVVTSSIEQVFSALEEMKGRYRDLQRSPENISKLVALYICSNIRSSWVGCLKNSYHVGGRSNGVGGTLETPS